MKKNVIIILCSLVIIIFNIVLLNLLLSKNNENIVLFSRVNELLIKESIIKKQFFLQQSFESMCIPDTILSKPNNIYFHSFSSLVKNGRPKLFFRFRETNCDACVQKTLRIIGGIVNEMPKDNIIILCSYTNARKFYAYKETQNICVYNVNEKFLPLDDQEEPYFFVLTDDLRIKNIFITIKEDDKYTIDYLNCIINRYYNHNKK